MSRHTTDMLWSAEFIAFRDFFNLPGTVKETNHPFQNSMFPYSTSHHMHKMKTSPWINHLNTLLQWTTFQNILETYQILCVPRNKLQYTYCREILVKYYNEQDTFHHWVKSNIDKRMTNPNARVNFIRGPLTYNELGLLEMQIDIPWSQKVKAIEQILGVTPQKTKERTIFIATK